MRTLLTFSVKGVALTSVEVDCTLSETHSGDVEATAHPVEEGAAVTDFVRAKPRTFQMEAALSDFPLHLEAGAAGTGEGRSAQALEALEAVRDAGGLVQVTTRMKSYEDLIITSISVPEDANRGGAIRFSMSMQQVRFVRTQTVRAVPGQRAKVKTNLPKAEPKQDEGQKVPKAASEPVATRAKSAFTQLGELSANAGDALKKFVASP